MSLWLCGFNTDCRSSEPLKTLVIMLCCGSVIKLAYTRTWICSLWLGALLSKNPLQRCYLNTQNQCKPKHWLLTLRFKSSGFKSCPFITLLCYAIKTLWSLFPMLTPPMPRHITSSYGLPWLTINFQFLVILRTPKEMTKQEPSIIVPS